MVAKDQLAVEREHDRISRELADAQSRASRIAQMAGDPTAAARSANLAGRMQAENDRYRAWASNGRKDSALYWGG
jgi:hypothetical protein